MKQNPVPSAQEIAEKVTKFEKAVRDEAEGKDVTSPNCYPMSVRNEKRVKAAKASLLSAITAAVAQEAEMLDWILGTADGREFIEYAMEHSVPIARLQIRKAMLNFDWPVAQAKEEEKVLESRWRHADGMLFCGTLRIAKADFDTDPSEDFKTTVFDQIVAALNAEALELKEPASDNVNAVLQNVRYLAALEHARSTFNEILTIHWGHDGDCGANRMANDGFDVVDNALKTALSEHSNAAGAVTGKQEAGE